MRFIFWWGFFSVILTGGIYFFERKDIVEIFIASLIVSLVFILFFVGIITLVKGVEDLDNKYKQGLLTGILIGIGLGWIMGEDES